MHVRCDRDTSALRNRALVQLFCSVEVCERCFSKLRSEQAQRSHHLGAAMQAFGVWLLVCALCWSMNCVIRLCSGVHGNAFVFLLTESATQICYAMFAERKTIAAALY